MIDDRSFLYGAALLKLIEFGGQISVFHYSHVHPSLYLIKTASICSVVLLKLSKKPTSAWSFNFSEHEDLAIRKIQFEKHKLFLGFICHKDGVCCISIENLKQILNRTNSISGQSISVSRPSRGRYRITGPGQRLLDRKIAQKDWPRIILSN